MEVVDKSIITLDTNCFIYYFEDNGKRFHPLIQNDQNLNFSSSTQALFLSLVSRNSDKFFYHPPTSSDKHYQTCRFVNRLPHWEQ